LEPFEAASHAAARFEPNYGSLRFVSLQLARDFGLRVMGQKIFRLLRINVGRRSWLSVFLLLDNCDLDSTANKLMFPGEQAMPTMRSWGRAMRFGCWTSWAETDPPEGRYCVVTCAKEEAVPGRQRPSQDCPPQRRGCGSRLPSPTEGYVKLRQGLSCKPEALLHQMDSLTPRPSLP
jgi:hypothetical protein